MATDIQTLAARIAADATDQQIDDAAFRQRTKRAAARLLKLLGAADGQRAAPRQGTATAPRYMYVAVPNGAGGVTSVSITRAVFDELAARLGGARAATALARQVAAGHKPGTGISRSAYVLKRLQQRAARAGQKRPARSEQHK